MTEIQKRMASYDLPGLKTLLTETPALANAGIPFDDANPALAHPLHRICDGVFAGTYTDAQGVAMARVFLEHGASIDGDGLEPNADTPLTAAASLLAEKVGILYVDKGADIRHAGGGGATALHWAAWTGLDALVDKLIRAGADINVKCTDIGGSPLIWALHGHKTNTGPKARNQYHCIQLLLQAGADKSVQNIYGKRAVDFLDENDATLKAVLS